MIYHSYLWERFCWLILRLLGGKLIISYHHIYPTQTQFFTELPAVIDTCRERPGHADLLELGVFVYGQSFLTIGPKYHQRRLKKIRLLKCCYILSHDFSFLLHSGRPIEKVLYFLPQTACQNTYLPVWSMFILLAHVGTGGSGWWYMKFSPGLGITKARSVNVSIKDIADFAKVSVSHFQTRSPVCAVVTAVNCGAIVKYERGV